MNEKSKIGGILTIVSGGFGILTGIAVAAFAVVIVNLLNSPALASEAMPDEFVTIMQLVYGGMGVFYVLLGVLSIIGGIMAIKRKHWGMALAGAIAATMSFYPVGIAAVIFVSMSQQEFTESVSPVTTPPVPPTPVG